MIRLFDEYVVATSMCGYEFKAAVLEPAVSRTHNEIWRGIVQLKKDGYIGAARQEPGGVALVLRDLSPVDPFGDGPPEWTSLTWDRADQLVAALGF